MLFTVITVSFKAGNKLKDTVLDILKQDYVNYEILVKDGNSADDSVPLLCDALEEAGFTQTKQEEKENAKFFLFEKKSSPRVRIYCEKDCGIYDAMNHAVAKAEGDFVIFMNCGDRFYEDTVLSKTAQRIAAKPDRRIYYGDAFFCKAGEIISQPKEITESVCYRHMPNHQACFFDRTLWEKQGFQTKYRIRADYDFFLRNYFEEGIRPGYLDLCVSAYEGGGYSETKENRKRDKEEHREIVVHYMGRKRADHYRRIMILTLQPLRTWIAQKSIFAGAYNSLKKKLYR